MKTKIQIFEGTLHNEIFLYRTEDGSEYFQFSYHQTSEGYEIDIHMQPDYGDRSTDIDTIHRVISNRNYVEHMICFMSGQNPQTFEEAQDFSVDWAELTHNYILTGETIDSQIKNR